MKKAALPLLIALTMLIPISASAHGGMQKVVEAKYIVNLTSVPMTPTVGQVQQNILAISDLHNNLIEKDMIFSIHISKNEQEVYSAANLVATGGLLQFNYTFDSEGTYELFADFKFPGESHLYQPEDFMIEVNPASKGGMPTDTAAPFVIAVFCILVGFKIGRMVGPCACAIRQ